MKYLILIVAICAVSCKKLKSSYDCKCSNGASFHIGNEYELAKGYCEMRQRNINDTAKNDVTCKLK